MNVDSTILKIKKRIRNKNKRVAIPDGEDIRVIKSLWMTPEVVKVLIGDTVVINDMISQEYTNTFVEIMEMVEIIDLSDYNTEEDIEEFVKITGDKIDYDNAREYLGNPPYVATLLLQRGFVDAVVGGSTYSTAEILRPALQIIKARDKIVSSYFLMKRGEEKLLFADCAVNIDPTPEELKEIAKQTIKTAEELEINPRVAFLSYSTKGSGRGPGVEKVQEAFALLLEENPDLKKYVDGELQFDTAVSKAVADVKAPGSAVAGRANVFIFPDLESGNIAYKVAEYMGDWEAIGPLLQGLNKPVNDLSRGTTPETIAQVIYLSLLEVVEEEEI